MTHRIPSRVCVYVCVSPLQVPNAAAIPEDVKPERFDVKVRMCNESGGMDGMESGLLTAGFLHPPARRATTAWASCGATGTTPPSIHSMP